MKRILSSLLLLALCAGTQAQQVSVNDVEALPGETVTMALLVDTDGGSYTGMEFDIMFSQDGFSTTGSATTTRTGWDGAFTIGDVGGVGIERLARCGVLSYSATDIPGEGLLPLGSVEVAVDENLSLGDYMVTLTNITLIGESRVPVADATFKLQVVSVHTVVLDENNTSMPEPAEGVNVRVRRTIKAGEWSTICLPFAMTMEQMKAAFGSDVQLSDFTGYETEEDEDGNVVSIKVDFMDATSIEANHPYIIKVAQNVTEFTANGVDIDPEEEPTVAAVKRTKKQWSEMVGTYVPMTIDNQMLFLSGNKFWYSTGKTQTKGYRAYFDFYDVLTEVEEAYSSRISFSFGDETTGNCTIDRQAAGYGKTYDLQGRKMVKPAKKGIYVRDGKKMIVR